LIGMRQGWWNAVLIGIAVVPAAAMLLIERADSSSDTDDIDTTPAIVGSIVLHITPTPPGGVVFASVTISADRPVHVDGIRVDVQDAQGRSQDAAGRVFSLPASGPLELRVDAQTVTEARQIRQSGTYSYVLAYRQNGTWTTLPPINAFTIK
jgi:hypothetical protein